MNFRRIALALGAASLAACSKGETRDISAPLPAGAEIKFFNFATGVAPDTTPMVNFYLGGTKITAVSTGAGTVSPIGTAMGGVGNGGLYSIVASGQYTATGKISDTTAANKGVTIATAQVTLAEGKFYSFYMSGFYDKTARTTDAFYVEDVLPAIDFSGAYVRFVNASANSSPMVLYAQSTSDPSQAEVALGGLTVYKAGGAFVKLPAGTYTLSTRTAGSATNVVTRTGVSFSAGRVYTIAALGSVTQGGTTSPNRIRLDNTANR